MNIVAEFDELDSAMPISYRFARGIIGMAFVANAVKQSFDAHTDYSVTLKTMIKEYLDRQFDRSTEWSTVFRFISLMWPSVILEFTAMIDKQNPIQVTSLEEKFKFDLFCKINGNVIFITKSPAL